MTTIVYDGVGGGGNLFAGTKFFILQRVPSRTRWKELIESNGGEVVKIEQQADILIADHARKICPTGAISWKYIEESVKNGALANIEEYRAGPATHTIREVGSGQPTKNWRTPFTAEDDRILMEWVTKAERKGALIKGNEIYKQLEEKNPRHTFQSWRDHWIKHLAHLPRPELLEDESYSSGDPAARALPPASGNIPTQYQRTTARRATTAASFPDPLEDSPQPRARPGRPTPRHAVTQRQFASSPVVKSPRKAKSAEKEKMPFVAKSSGGNNFSNEEKQFLLNGYDDIMNIDEDQAINAWAAWAVENPNHTAQEWRNYFVKVVMPQKSAQAGMEEEAPVTEIKKASDIIPRSSPSRQVPARRLEISDSQATIPETIPSQNSDNKAPDLYLTDEKLFKKHLVELAASLEEELIVNFNPIICGRTIPLFKLWQVVRSQELGGYDEVTGRNLWTQVARKLNFSDFQHPDAHLDLKMCYEEILADFEGWLDYKETQPDLTESQENAMIESQLRRTAERETQNVGEDIAEEDGDEDYDDDLDAPSSMPQPLKSSPKRIFGDDRSSQGPTSIKRQRIDKGKGKELEVPSTPEDVINSNRMPRPSYQQSPLNLASTVIGVDDEDELLLRPIPRPNFSGASNAHQKRAFEPETQDFHFPLPDNDDRGPFESLSSSNRKRILDGSNSGTTRRAPIDEDDAGPAASIPSRIQRRPDSGSNVVTYERFVDDSSTQSLTQSQRETELRAFIDRYVALGYSYDIVIDALEATTMETGDAGLVMEQLTNGGGIPENHQGVWTAWDDEALQADDDSEEFRRLLEKHGMKRVLTRHKFLDDLKEVRRESEGILD